ncbi:metallo-beta-lactamase domain-containing protein 1 isoform X2 [Anabrus simplex]|uniref:metallo-beta-lactamase domain-containing protein 1 isoform X2 n=1 Tax=Anabrus simplex TaxID=316456 RepID=UPI0034DD557D
MKKARLTQEKGRGRKIQMNTNGKIPATPNKHKRKKRNPTGIMGYSVHVLYDGYSKMTDEGMKANCTCTLIKGRKKIIVDTMTPWDKQRIIDGLAQHNLSPDEIDYVVCTHGHSDHIGNNNLFLNAKHIVGFSLSCKDLYYIHPFETGDLFEREEDIAEPYLWQHVAGSDEPDLQQQNRNKTLELADWIVPGHGPMFRVTPQMKKHAEIAMNPSDNAHYI